MDHRLERRKALKKVSYLIGGAVATPTLLSVMKSCRQSPAPLEWQAQFLDEEQARLLSEVVEIIIPETDTPGAKQAGVPMFIDTMLEECLKPKAQSLFIEGLGRIQTLAQSKYRKDFLKLESDQQHSVIKQIATEDYQAGENKDIKPFFKQLKELTLLGYFNSEAGATEALAYLQIPGAYDNCTTLAPNQKAWAM